MPVYVDDMYKKPMGHFGRMKMSHMMADTTEELLDMATKIGLKHKWLQKPGTRHEHFDVSLTKRREAVHLGAHEMTMREMGHWIISKKNIDRGLPDV